MILISMIEVSLFKKEKTNLDFVVDLLYKFVFDYPIDYLSNCLSKCLFVYPNVGYDDFNSFDDV